MYTFNFFNTVIMVIFAITSSILIYLDVIKEKIKIEIYYSPEDIMC